MTTSTDQTYELHPLCTLWPQMPEDEFEDLVDSIREVGLLEPITLYKGQVLDGGHRYRACLQAEVTPQFIDFDGEAPGAYVAAKNGHRRHLSAKQRALAVIEATAWKKRDGDVVIPEALSEEEEPEVLSVSDQANLAGVSETEIYRARRSLADPPPIDKAPELPDGAKAEEPKPAKKKPTIELEEAREAIFELENERDELRREVESRRRVEEEGEEDELGRLHTEIKALQVSRDGYQSELAELKKTHKRVEGQLKSARAAAAKGEWERVSTILGA